MKLLSLLLALCLLLGAYVSGHPEDKSSGRPLCPCPRNMEPVCGSNDVTYSNRCLFECEQRSMERSGRSLKLLRTGEC
ncbi:protease inhibitor 2 [Drosophila innubila]|uniref:protease inhibitor 2 n=1 Tax=Drosophila innubila TaxID=198719 RepID=UPI00148E824C|nr:protease inhibitor 2 [Drosophila innubila]